LPIRRSLKERSLLLKISKRFFPLFRSLTNFYFLDF
jgi:hypothetical protein